jgi:two-component system, NarL family, response regulator NreC
MQEKTNARILIADDHESTRKTLKALVETCATWKVCGEAADGEQAVQKASELQPDLIVMDLSMPHVDGLAAARAISSAMPEVPILIYTLYVSPELAVEAKKAGVRQIVDKAGTRGKLLTAMTMMLANSGFHVMERENGSSHAASKAANLT